MTRVSLFVWLLPFDLSGMGAPTSSYATAGIALRGSGALKPHHHDKVETPSVGIFIATAVRISETRSLNYLVIESDSVALLMLVFRV
jgi:hypothetical protein